MMQSKLLFLQFNCVNRFSEFTYLMQLGRHDDQRLIFNEWNEKTHKFLSPSIILEQSHF